MPSPIHSASWANFSSTAAAPAAVLAVTSGVSTESIRIGIRMFGVSPSVTSTSARSPRDGMLVPAGDHNTCTGSIITLHLPHSTVFCERAPGAGRDTRWPGQTEGRRGARAVYRKTTVLLPCTSTRSSRCQRRPRASTRRSMSRPRRTMSDTVSSWFTRITSCSTIGPASRSAVT